MKELRLDDMALLWFNISRIYLSFTALFRYKHLERKRTGRALSGMPTLNEGEKVAYGCFVLKTWRLNETLRPQSSLRK